MRSHISKNGDMTANKWGKRGETIEIVSQGGNNVLTRIEKERNRKNAVGEKWMVSKAVVRIRCDAPLLRLHTCGRAGSTPTTCEANPMWRALVSELQPPHPGCRTSPPPLASLVATRPGCRAPGRRGGSMAAGGDELKRPDVRAPRQAAVGDERGGPMCGSASSAGMSSGGRSAAAHRGGPRPAAPRSPPCSGLDWRRPGRADRKRCGGENTQKVRGQDKGTSHRIGQFIVWRLIENLALWRVVYWCDILCYRNHSDLYHWDCP
jgi:hypothetical protein